MLNLLFSIAGFICLVISGPQKEKVDTTFSPRGKFINTTVLNKCPESMPSDVPHFCFELYFRGNGSVLIDNGFEKYTLPVTEAGDGNRFKIEGASLFGDMIIIMDADSTLQLIDTAWTKLETFSSFARVLDEDFSDIGFEYALNECLLTGEYVLFENGNLTSYKVTIFPNGQMNGFRPFLGYGLCYAGDCLEETDPPARTIELIDRSGKKEIFAFKSVEGKMAIELYRIGPPLPDSKGGRSIGEMVYELRSE